MNLVWFWFRSSLRRTCGKGEENFRTTTPVDTSSRDKTRHNQQHPGSRQPDSDQPRPARHYRLYPARGASGPFLPGLRRNRCRNAVSI